MTVVPASAAGLSPLDRASFATSSRFLSCLVTESLLKAIFVPARCTLQKQFIGTTIVLNTNASKFDGPYSSTNIFAVIPLRHIPIFKPGSKDEIGLLDPLDMLPRVYELYSTALPEKDCDIKRSTGSPDLEAQLLAALSQVLCDSTHVSLMLTPGPLHLWTKFADGFNIDKDMQASITEELWSSVAWQKFAYENPRPHVPTFNSPSIAWEQCIIEGHPIHPMHKARRALPPIATIHPGDYDWERPLIRLVAVPRASMRIQGAWDDLLAPVYDTAAKNAKKPIDVPEDHVIIPLHALQVENIREKFPEARILSEEYHVEALAQQSLRSVLVLPALHSLSLKLAIGVRLTSAMRTISPASAFLGPRFSSVIVPRLSYDRALLVVQRELASVVHVHSDYEIAKHLGAIVREAYENTSVEEHGERVIVCTALVETGYGGEDEVPLVQSVFGLDTEEKRTGWFEKYVDIYLKAFLPSVIANGVAFEAHPQNTLARFDIQTRELKGFVIRDFGGLRIHPPTVIASTDLKTLDDIIAPGHSIIADTLEDVYTRLYHTLIHNHLQQLIRVLNLHHSGLGWDIVRRHLNEQIPIGHQLRQLWLSPETENLPGKCFMRMRMQGMYRTHLHSPFVNLIHYPGTAVRAKIAKL